MKILVRLPNWLGDLVMSLAFLEALKQEFPDADIQVIVKEGLQPILAGRSGILPPIGFSKRQYPGLKGIRSFCRTRLAEGSYDLFFALPDSFSSAWMGLMSGSRIRVGYRKDGRGLLLTHGYAKKAHQHRVLQYLDLLSLFLQRPVAPKMPLLPSRFTGPFEYIVFNTNSEADSRRLSVDTARKIATELLHRTDKKILLTGSPAEQAHVQSILAPFEGNSRIRSLAGQTSLSELIEVLGKAAAMLSTDSGPAHLANALGTPLLVLFGAGDEKQTSPFNSDHRIVWRLGRLSCEPCQKNTCKFGTPKCLAELDETALVTLFLPLVR